MAEQTPGPWAVDYGGPIRVMASDARQICVLPTFDRARAVANARLIASAPDMASRIAELEAERDRLRDALRTALDEWQSFVESDYEGTQSYRPMMDAVDAVRIALEDSEGES